MRSKYLGLHVPWTLALIILVAGQMLAQQYSTPELPDPGSPPISREKQIELGFQAAAEVYKQMPVLPDNSPETQYVRQLGNRLAATIPKEYSWPFEFHTIAQKDINAFALPGGPMFVNIGTITAADNEAELAGVMAHEMAHVYMQHSAKQMQKASLTQGLAGLAGAILGAKGGALGSLAQAGVQVGAGFVMLKYSRSDEAQADAVGAIILYKAGYNPIALADFFHKLDEESGGAGPQFLSDHPNPGNREAAIEKEVSRWPPKQFKTNSPQFIQVKQHASTVKTYTAEEISQGAKTGQWEQLNRKNGAVFKAPPGVNINPSATPASGTSPGAANQSDVIPSNNLVSSDLGGVMKISRPENWEIMPPQQQGQALTIAPRAGVTSNGVGYGVVINGASATNGQQANIDQMTTEIVRSMQSGGGDLQTVGSAQPITVAGVRGRSVNMQSTSPFPDANGEAQKEKDWLVTVPRPDGSVIYMVFVAPQAKFERFRPTFEKMLNSVQF